MFGIEISDQGIVKRLKETIEFLKVESVRSMWNTPQLIDIQEEINFLILPYVEIQKILIKRIF